MKKRLNNITLSALAILGNYQKIPWKIITDGKMLDLWRIARALYNFQKKPISNGFLKKEQFASECFFEMNGRIYATDKTGNGYNAHLDKFLKNKSSDNILQVLSQA